MDGVIYKDSPLAEYLEGEGTGDAGWIPAQPSEQPPNSQQADSFAPQGAIRLQEKIRKKLRHPLRIRIPSKGPVARLHAVCSRAVNSRLGKADNARFLEHFRYIIISSQILDECANHNAGQRPIPVAAGGHTQSNSYLDNHLSSTTIVGAILTGAAAFAVVWLIHWAREPRSSGARWGRIVAALAASVVIASFVYLYARRQQLQSLRRQSLDDASVLVTNIQAVQSSTASALTLIQEVELVSRGYRLSSPLPPVTRLEERGQGRRCARLRKSLQSGFGSVIPVLQDACDELSKLVDDDKLDKFLDVYDVNNVDIQEARAAYSEDEFDDAESLKALRTLEIRVITLHRLVLCCLLSLEADGGREDLVRWQIVARVIQRVAVTIGAVGEKLNDILQEEDQFNIPPTPRAPPTPGRERLRTQIRRLASLSSGIRGIQAKMQILREESNQTLETSEEHSELSARLMTQYDSIGEDLKSLVQAWESGKAALAVNIDKYERRISQASSGLRSPAPSLGGLTAVDEGSPSDALRALNGETNTPSDLSHTSSGSVSDEEIFEAIAMPRRRATMTREERQAKIQEDRVRQAAFREQRDASTSMIRELESVINLRPKKAAAQSRITSI